MNDGRVLMAMVTPGSTFRLSGEEASAATLQYAIFHSPSEHVFTDANGNDIRYAAELQLHHRTAAGLITVVSVLFKVNAPSPFIDKLFGKIPKSCESTQTELPVKFEDALPFSRTYYEYTGSLTSPPCTDSVTWYVLREQSTISLEQIEKLRETFGLDMKKAPTPVASASPHEISVLDKDAFPDYTFSEKLMGNVRPLQDLGDRPLAATPSSL
jgi:carbonic anhydrase